jgi:hypothetical protein
MLRRITWRFRHPSIVAGQRMQPSAPSRHLIHQLRRKASVCCCGLLDGKLLLTVIPAAP